MHHYSQSFEIENISEFRSILHEISLENQQSIKYQLAQYLENQDLTLKSKFFRLTKKLPLSVQRNSQKRNSVSTMCLNSHVSNLFTAVHLLNELETKNDSLSRVNEELYKLNTDFQKVLANNEELARKIELIEDQNYQFKNKIQQAETYISEVSQTETVKSSIEPQIDIHVIEISEFSKKCSHLTERPSLANQKILTEEIHLKLEQCQQKLERKSLWIIELEKEIKDLKDKIIHLENQLSMKSSELQLSEIYFKEKIDIIASTQSINRSQEVSLSEIQINSVFRKDLQRVNSFKSIGSIVESENSQNSQNSYDKYQDFESEKTHKVKKNDVRMSLLQDFVTDFGIQAHGQSDVDRDSNSPDSNSFFRNRKKSISVSTTDMKKTSSKGVQTAYDPITKIIKRTSNQYTKKVQQKKEPHETSFLGLGSLASIFSKKNIENGSICEAVQNQAPTKNDYSILGQSSLGYIFKGILDYATRKIVTNRVHRKSKVNLNQSFTQELNRTLSRNKSYIKGKKY